MSNELNTIQNTSHSLENKTSEEPFEIAEFASTDIENNFIDRLNIKSNLYTKVVSAKSLLGKTSRETIKDISLDSIQSIEASLF